MTNERRQARRVRCFLPARTPKGEAIIDEVSSDGCRLNGGFQVVKGDELTLEIEVQGGDQIKIPAVVTRVWPTSMGCRLACRFSADARSASERLVRLVSARRKLLR